MGGQLGRAAVDQALPVEVSREAFDDRPVTALAFCSSLRRWHQADDGRGFGDCDAPRAVTGPRRRARDGP